MSDELSQVLQKLEEQDKAIVALAKSQEQQPDIVDKSGKYFKWIQGLIALVAVILSLGVSYGVTTTKLASLQDKNSSLKGEISKLEGKLEAHQKAEKAEKEKLQADVHALQLSQARDDQLFKSMEKNFDELKSDVKKLLRRR